MGIDHEGLIMNCEEFGVNSLAIGSGQQGRTYVKVGLVAVAEV